MATLAVPFCPIPAVGSELLCTPIREYGEFDTLDVSRVDIFDRYEYSWKMFPGGVSGEALLEYERPPLNLYNNP